MRKFMYLSPDSEEETGVEEPELFKEDGDDILVKIDDEPTEVEEDDSPELDPEEDSPEEDSETTPSPEDGEPIEEEDSQDNTDKRLSDAQAKITELSESLKEMNAKLEKANLSPEELREQLTSREVKVLLDEERARLRDMNPDEVTRQEIVAQQRVVDELADEFSDKSQKEAIKDVVQSGENKKFKAEMKETLKEKYEIEGEEYSNVTRVAEDHYLENGKLTERSYHHAMVSIYGLDRVMKSVEISSEEKARRDIAKATEKEQAGIDASGKGNAGTYVNLDELVSNPKKFNRYLAKLTPEQHDKFEEMLAKRGKM